LYSRFRLLIFLWVMRVCWQNYYIFILLELDLRRCVDSCMRLSLLRVGLPISSRLDYTASRRVNLAFILHSACILRWASAVVWRTLCILHLSLQQSDVERTLTVFIYSPGYCIALGDLTFCITRLDTGRGIRPTSFTGFLSYRANCRHLP